MKRRFLFVLTSLLAAAAAPAWSQSFPNKPIRLVVTFPPGGAPDILARLFGEKAQLGQTIVIDNKPGAGGNIGADFVESARPQGLSIQQERTGKRHVSFHHQTVNENAFDLPPR